jgi:Tfp pilus assembly protein PilV
MRWRPMHASAGQTGFSIVEILLATAIFSILVGALAGIVIYGQASAAISGDRIRADQLAEEGVEAVRNIRNAGYSNLTDGAYGLVQSGNVWTLSGTSDTNGIYSRQTTIASGGSNRKDVTSTVSWLANGQTRTASVTTRLTNWRADVTNSAPNWSAVSQKGGLDVVNTQDALKVVTVGNYAYIVRGAANPNLIIVNISNPSAPALVGTLALGGSPTNIFVSGNYAYVTNSSDSAELQIISIANPASPSLIATYNATGNANANAVYVANNTAYIARDADSSSSAYELTILNVATPSAPVLAGGYDNNTASMTDVVVDNGTAFLGTNNSASEILQVNISVPLMPVLTTFTNLSTSGTVNDIKIAAGKVYIAQGSSLSIMDESTTAAMNRSGVVTISGGVINDITLDNTNTYAFIGTSSPAAEFQTINVSTPASASVASTADIAGTSSSLNGVAYSPTWSVVIGASAADREEVLIFGKN